MKKHSALLLSAIAVLLTGCNDNNQIVDNSTDTSENIIVTDSAPMSTKSDLSKISEEIEQRYNDDLPVLIRDISEIIVPSGFSYDEWITTLSFNSTTPYPSFYTDTNRIISDGYQFVMGESGSEIIYKYLYQERNRITNYKILEIGIDQNDNRVAMSNDKIVEINDDDYTVWQDVENYTLNEPMSLYQDELERVVALEHNAVIDENGKVEITYNYLRQTRQKKPN